MSPTAPPEHDRTDPELISCVRGGDVAAYGELFSRHVDAANRLARLLVGEPDADDLVSEAFVKVLNVLLAGGGPDVAFRAYLLTAVRRLHVDRVRSARRVTPAGDLAPWDPGVPFTDTAVAGFEGGAAARAFASLPERWQMVLWHLEVEKQKPADIAPLLGMSPNSVSALAYRAREGLRQAFLTMHCGDLVSEACRETSTLLGGYVRGGLSRRDSARVAGHLDQCRRCSAVHLELTEVNDSLSGLLAPALLGTVAAAYVATAGTGLGAGVAGLGTAVLAAVGRGRDLVLGNIGAVAGGVGTATAAATVAGVTAIAVVQGPTTEDGSGTPSSGTSSDPSSSGNAELDLGSLVETLLRASADARDPEGSARASGTTTGTATRTTSSPSTGATAPTSTDAETGTPSGSSVVPTAPESPVVAAATPKSRPTPRARPSDGRTAGGARPVARGGRPTHVAPAPPRGRPTAAPVPPSPSLPTPSPVGTAAHPSSPAPAPSTAGGANPLDDSRTGATLSPPDPGR